VDAFPDANAVTDENGFFRLEDVPAPVFSVHIDGSTAENAPEGTEYATVGKLFHSVPGQETQLTMDGETFDIFLPPMATGDIQPLPETGDTDVGFGDAGMAQLEELFPDVDASVWELTQVTFPAGSAQDEEGNAATQATIIPVDPERLPAPLPPNIDPQLVISIQAGGDAGFSQAGGATNFDVPAPVTFPNLDGLAPGTKSLIWSFNHDSGDWEAIGTGTVSEDGLSVVSDPGMGILAPGWHFVNPGTPISGPEKPDGDCDPNVFTWENVIDLFEEVAKCAAGFKGLSGIVSKIFKLSSEIKSLIGNASSLWQQIKEGEVDAGAIRAGFRTLNSVKKTALATFSEIKDQNPLGRALAISKCLEGLLGFASSTCDNIRQEDSDCDTIIVRTVCRGLELAKATLGKVNSLIETIDEGLDDALLALACGTIDQIAAAIGFAEIQENQSLVIVRSEESLATVETIDVEPVIGQLETLITQLGEFQTDVEVSEEFISILDETTEEIAGLDNDANNLYAATVGYPANAFYIIEYEGFEIRGVTDDNGQLNTVLPPNTDFSLSIYDPLTKRIATYSGQTEPSGSPSQIPSVRFVTTEGVTELFDRIGEELTSDITEALTEEDINGLSDADNDGLVDEAERIIGTVSTSVDTDGDGINDLAEIQQGLDPLGDRGFPTGIISSLPLQGQAKAVVVEGSPLDAQDQTAYVATGSHGLAIVDASQFDSPIVLGQLDLSGDATDVAVDANLQIAAIASNGGGLHLVDVSDPMLPTTSNTVNISANQVEIADGIAYATVGNALRAIDLLTGEELNSITLPGSGTVTDVSREGTSLYAFTSGSDTFSVIDIADEQALNVLGQVNVNIASSQVGVFAANGVAYLAGSGLRTIDVSDPSNPSLLGDADQFFTAREVALNGSGLALVASEDQGLEIYDVTDPQDTDAFLTVIDTPGFARDVAIASGIAFVADDSGDLQVVNYRPFDNLGVAPTMEISSGIADVDPNTPGVQVTEGSSIPVFADVTDDVQVRNVELLVDGEVVSNAVSFPFELAAIALSNDPDAEVVEVQA